MKKKCGFTLIELLVVIAIIAVLAAILFPIFSSAKKKGQQMSCISNMSQLGKSMRMYLDDNNCNFCGDAMLGRFRDTYAPARARSGPEYIWMFPKTDANLVDGYYAAPQNGCLRRYIRSANIFICPSDSYAKYFKASYSMNGELSFYKESDVKFIPKTIQFVDEACLKDHPTANDGHHMVDGHFMYGQDYIPVAHINGANFTFCDGHVKWFESSKFGKLNFYRNPIQYGKNISDYIN